MQEVCQDDGRRLLDKLGGLLEDRGRDRQPERLGRLEVDDEVGLGRLLDRRSALQDLVRIRRRPAD